MNSKNTIKYLIYLIIIISLYYLGSSILAKHYEDAKITFLYNYWLITLVKLVFFGGIGMVLGLDKFLSELNWEGKWKFDISKLIILGIPSLIFSMQYLVLAFIQIPSSFSSVFIIANIVLGYTIISSLYKEH